MRCGWKRSLVGLGLVLLTLTSCSADESGQAQELGPVHLMLRAEDLPAERFIDLPVSSTEARTSLYLYARPSAPTEDALGIAVLAGDATATDDGNEDGSVQFSSVGDLQVGTRRLPSGELLAALSRTESPEVLEGILANASWSSADGVQADVARLGLEQIGTGSIDAPFMGYEANLLTDVEGYAWMHTPPDDPMSSLVVSVQPSDARLEDAYRWYRGDAGTPSDVAAGAVRWTPPEAAESDGPPPLEVSFITWRVGEQLVVVDCRLALSSVCERYARLVSTASEQEFEAAKHALA